MNRRHWGRRTTLAAIALVGFGCSLGDATTPDERSGRRILFIGSQATYYYSMPLIVEAFGDAQGLSPLAVDMVAFPDYTLRDHQLNGAALSAINRGGWELVVLQQGPSESDAARSQLRESTKALSVSIKDGGARPALYMPWPSVPAIADLPRVVESYTAAASDVDGLLFPVGVAFDVSNRRDVTIPLYQFDGINPSPFGSYLAAAVIFAKIYNKSPIGLPTQVKLRYGDVITIPPAIAAVLQASAAEATGFITP